MKKLLTLAVALMMVLGIAASAGAVTIGFSQIGQES
ncbi:MAG: sugar ABC transporter substrate-binding protein, partial [Clostridiales bacterium]|nr:sugar ABC transporter substrate-binding protein [Clostridiales bacterium]